MKVFVSRAPKLESGKKGQEKDCSHAAQDRPRSERFNHRERSGKTKEEEPNAKGAKNAKEKKEA